jgi:hypothetical protein
MAIIDSLTPPPIFALSLSSLKLLTLSRLVRGVDPGAVDRGRNAGASERSRSMREKMGAVGSFSASSGDGEGGGGETADWREAKEAEESHVGGMRVSVGGEEGASTLAFDDGGDCRGSSTLTSRMYSGSISTEMVKSMTVGGV